MNASGSNKKLNELFKQQTTKKMSNTQLQVSQYINQQTKKNPLGSPNDSLLSALIEEEDSMLSRELNKIAAEETKRKQPTMKESLSQVVAKKKKKTDEVIREQQKAL